MNARSHSITEAAAAAEALQRPAEAKRRVNMHEGIPDWYDCCSCEAEPYWAELAEEAGSDPTDCGGNDAGPRRKE